MEMNLHFIKNNIKSIFSYNKIFIILTFYILILINNYTNYYYLQSNNKNKWYISIHLTLLFSCILYYILIVTICIIYMFFFHKKVHISESLEILKMSFLMFLSSYFIITLYLNLILILKKHNISYIIIICILYSSILLGNLLSIDQFLPLNRCILAKHYSLNLKYSVSYTYLTVLIIVNYLISKKNILLNDFINYLT